MTDRVKLLLRGRMREKFVGRAVQEGICFERIEHTAPREMVLIVRERDARRLLAMAEEYRIDLTVTEEEGLPVRRRQIKERITLLPALMLCAALIYLFCARTWQVEAVSLDGMTDESVLRLIEEYVREQSAPIGGLREAVDRNALAADIQLHWSELTHVGVRWRGVCLLIEVAAEHAAPEVYDVSQNRDLRAARDAVVLYVEPLAGKACVKAGDTVRRGQVLIRGEERIDGNAVRSVRALGEVIGRVWFEGECTVSLTETVRRRTGESRLSARLGLGDWSVTLSEAEDYPCQDVEEEHLPVGGLYLPLKIVRTKRWEVREDIRTADESVLRKQAEAQALADARAKLPEGARESAYWTEYIKNGEVLTVRVVVEAQMNIAEDQSK